ncbi:MAG: WD40 repeat domain-containing protein [Planctomycetes bacterium]|nr:WD40 repeat domain-containing protein [Planctomycetota bacterium]
MIWREYLDDPSSISARWALREHYSRYSILSSIHTGIHVIRDFVLSPDEKWVAVTGDSTQVEIWDRSKRRRIATLEASKRFIDELAFSPDGSLLAGAADDGGIYLWNTNDWSIRGIMRGHRPEARSVCFLRGDRLLSGARDGVLAVWDTKSGENLAAWTAHRLGILSIRISLDQRTIATASYDQTIALWHTDKLVVADADAKPFKPIPPPEDAKSAVISGHVDTVNTVDFSGDGRLLASSSSGLDRTVRIWNLATGTCETMRPSVGVLDPIAFSRDSKTIYGSGWFTLDVFDVRLHRLTGSTRGKFTRVKTTSTDHEIIASTVQDIVTWDARPSPSFLSLGPLSGRSVAFASGGSVLVTSQPDGSIQLRDAETGEIQSTLTPTDAKPTPEDRLIRMRTLCVNPTGDKVASVSFDKVLRLWDIPSGRCETRSPMPVKTQQSVAFNPDGTSWAQSRSDAKFAIWKTGASEPFCRLSRRWMGGPVDRLFSRWKTACDILAGMGRPPVDVRGQADCRDSLQRAAVGRCIQPGWEKSARRKLALEH